MSKTTEGIKLIQEDFKERYGADVKMDIYVHDAGKAVAEKITAEAGKELGVSHSHDFNKGSFWAVAEKDKVSIIVFYQPEKEAVNQ